MIEAERDKGREVASGGVGDLSQEAVV